jgi:hypothetical protein
MSSTLNFNAHTYPDKTLSRAEERDWEVQFKELNETYFKEGGILDI